MVLEHNRTLDLGHPPRHVPLGTQLMLLFGGMLHLFGWVFFGAGMLFVMLFGVPQWITAQVVTIGPSATVTGTVQEVHETGASENEATVMAYTIAYNTPSGPQTATNYGFGYLEPGAEVAVIYPTAFPHRGVATELRATMFDGFVLFTLIFPVLGLTFLVVQFRKGAHAIRLLREGVATSGLLTDTSPTGTTINNVPVMALTYEYQVGPQTYQVKAKVLQTQMQHLMDETGPDGQPRELLLYHPHYPEKAQVVDELSKEARFDRGRIVPSPAGRLVRNLFLPVLVVGGLLVLGWFLYR